MKTWWQSLQIREQALLGVVALVAGFVLVDGVFLESYRLKNQQLSEQLEQAKDDLAWMKEAVQKVNNGPQGQKQRMNGRIVSFVDQQIQRMRLKDKMQQMTPIQDHSVRVRLEEVGFTQLLNFLAQIDGAVLIEEVRILPSDTEGVVNASLVLSKDESAS